MKCIRYKKLGRSDLYFNVSGKDKTENETIAGLKVNLATLTAIENWFAKQTVCKQKLFQS